LGATNEDLTDIGKPAVREDALPIGALVLPGAGIQAIFADKTW